MEQSRTKITNLEYSKLCIENVPSERLVHWNDQLIYQFNAFSIISKCFFLVLFQKYVAKMAEAIEESILDSFTLKPILTEGEKFARLSNPRIKKKDILIYGQIKGINKNDIFIEINDQHYADYIKDNCQRRHFDIYFQLNIMTYQLQHNALKWLKLHNLFDLLIDHPDYNAYTSGTKDNLVADYKFR